MIVAVPAHAVERDRTGPGGGLVAGATGYPVVFLLTGLLTLTALRSTARERAAARERAGAR